MCSLVECRASQRRRFALRQLGESIEISSRSRDLHAAGGGLEHRNLIALLIAVEVTR